jgi:hypothetical protein
MARNRAGGATPALSSLNDPEVVTMGTAPRGGRLADNAAKRPR